MSTVDPTPHRIFVSTRHVYAWSLALLAGSALFLVPYFLGHDLRSFHVSMIERIATVPLLLYAHELLHVAGFRLAHGVAGDEIAIRLSRRSFLPHVALRVPVTVRRFRVATALPGLLLGIAPLVAGACIGSGKLLVIGALMTAAAGGDLALLRAVRPLDGGALVEPRGEWSA